MQLAQERMGRMNRKELEIMAPAGNFECLRAAIQGGADSVYFGVGRLNMRSHSANNFAPEDLAEVVRICREAGVKSYLTLNIVLYPEDLEDMRAALLHRVRLKQPHGLPKPLTQKSSVPTAVKCTDVWT